VVNRQVRSTISLAIQHFICFFVLFKTTSSDQISWKSEQDLGLSCSPNTTCESNFIETFCYLTETVKMPILLTAKKAAIIIKA